MSKNRQHEAVLELYATSILGRKTIARKVAVSHDSVRTIVHRARRSRDARARARDNPLVLLPYNVRRRLKREAERAGTTEQGLAAAILEIVLLDYRLFLQVKSQADVSRRVRK